MFINPYNFIPLGEEKAKSEKEEGNYTGVINYKVLTKTPVFIPNTSNSDTFNLGVEDHKSYDFFSYNNLADLNHDYSNTYYMPVIPGSEMRGMIRSNYEIMTDSCMSSLDSDTVLSKRTNEVFKAGLLKKLNGGYALYAAKDYIWRTKGTNNTNDELNWKDGYYTRKCYIQSGYKEGEKILFNPINRTKGRPIVSNVTKYNSTVSGKTVGYIMKGEDGPVMNTKAEKHCCHVFVPQGNIVSKDIDIQILKTALKEYKDNDVHLYKEYKEQFDNFCQGSDEYFPVYYSTVVSGFVMLSPASITREIYKNTLKNLVKTFQTCEDPQNLCPACALFGMVSKKGSMSSRIRFSDLKCLKENAQECYDSIVTLKPLSSPKLNNMEFYLKRPDHAWFWTYDYYIDEKGDVIEYKNPVINGRKFYWHHLNMKLPHNVEKTNLNMTIRPVKKGISFEGKLYFEHLTKKELDTLIWIMNTGDFDNLQNKKHGYKIGAAKPLGLGSIALAIDSVQIKGVRKGTDHIVERYVELYEKFDENLSFNDDNKKNFKKMTCFETVKENVNYPYVKNPETDNGFDWFVKNHKGFDRKKQKETGMPNSRVQMYYDEYMQPMEPELQETRAKIQSGNKAEVMRLGKSTAKNNPVKKQKKQAKVESAVIEKKKGEDFIVRVNNEIGLLAKRDNSEFAFDWFNLKVGQKINVSVLVRDKKQVKYKWIKG